MIDILLEIFAWAIMIASALFVVASVALFIKDGIASKREGRSRKKKYTVMFIISMAIIGLAAVLGILLHVLAVLIMRSM